MLNDSGEFQKVSIYFIFLIRYYLALRKGLGPLSSDLATKGIFVIGLVEISAVVLKKVHIIFEQLTMTKPPTTAENPGQSNKTQTEAEHRPTQPFIGYDDVP